MRAFVEARVKPYYLHHPDLALRTSHGARTIAFSPALMRELRQRLSGLAMPDYSVPDIPGARGKVPIGPNYVERGRATATRSRTRPPATRYRGRGLADPLIPSGTAHLNAASIEVDGEPRKLARSPVAGRRRRRTRAYLSQPAPRRDLEHGICPEIIERGIDDRARRQARDHLGRAAPHASPSTTPCRFRPRRAAWSAAGAGVCGRRRKIVCQSAPPGNTPCKARASRCRRSG